MVSSVYWKLTWDSMLKSIVPSDATRQPRRWYMHFTDTICSAWVCNIILDASGLQHSSLMLTLCATRHQCECELLSRGYSFHGWCSTIGHTSGICWVDNFTGYPVGCTFQLHFTLFFYGTESLISEGCKQYSSLIIWWLSGVYSCKR